MGGLGFGRDESYGLTAVSSDGLLLAAYHFDANICAAPIRAVRHLYADHWLP